MIKKSLNLILSLLALCSIIFLVGCNLGEKKEKIVYKDKIVEKEVEKEKEVVVEVGAEVYEDALGGSETRVDRKDADGKILEKIIKVTGRFSADRTWSKEFVYYLDGTVFIGNDNKNNCKLTIEAGTEIRGSVYGDRPGLLVVTRGSQIIANGTKEAPIVFTSSKKVGERASGDWGGIVINGNAKIHNGEAEGEGYSGKYGGTKDDDNSGSLKYVRVEFAGHIFTDENELNGIAFQGVGSGTTVDYIQVHRNADDGVEFFGGAVNVKHVVITGAADDSFDWTDGWRGSAQYVVLQQYDGFGDCGIEGDSDSSPTKEPVSNPTLANFTIVGSTVVKDNNKVNKTGAKFRKNTNATFANSMMKGFVTSFDEHSSDTNAGTIIYDGILVENIQAASDAVDYTATAATKKDSAATLNIPATSLDAVNVKPTAAITTTATVADLTTLKKATDLIEATTYFGAVDPAADSAWYKDWTATPKN